MPQKSAQNASKEQTLDTAEHMMKRFSDAELRSADSFEAALALAESTFGEVVDASTVIGSGFILLENKDRLIGEPFLALYWQFISGDYERAPGEKAYYVVAMIVTRRNERYVVTDGGAGIYAQLDEYTGRTSKAGGLLVNGGLRKSEYEVEVDGRIQPAVTYYLNV